jgi:hypothetical protein
MVVGSKFGELVAGIRLREGGKEVMTPPGRTTTLVQAYHALCQDEAPWVALGEFLHA